MPREKPQPVFVLYDERDRQWVALNPWAAMCAHENGFQVVLTTRDHLEQLQNREVPHEHAFTG